MYKEYCELKNDLNKLQALTGVIDNLHKAYLNISDEPITKNMIENAIYSQLDLYHTEYVELSDKMKKFYDHIYQFSDDRACSISEDNLNQLHDDYQSISARFEKFSDIARNISNSLKTYSEVLLSLGGSSDDNNDPFVINKRMIEGDTHSPIKLNKPPFLDTFFN